MPHQSPPEHAGPLSPQVFHILISLSDNDLHGYGIIREVEDRTAGAITLSAGTLYGALKRMLEGGLIEETERRPDPTLDDARRRYYRITPRGMDAARREAQRVEQLARAARDKGLLQPERRA